MKMFQEAGSIPVPMDIGYTGQKGKGKGGKNRVKNFHSKGTKNGKGGKSSPNSRKCLLCNAQDHFWAKCPRKGSFKSIKCHKCGGTGNPASGCGNRMTE